MRATIKDRLLSKISIQDNGCWLWTGSVSANGYGFLNVNYKTERAHRVSYQIFKGEIPDGLILDHLCRNTLCVNPDHLEAVNQSENIRRGVLPDVMRHFMASRTCCIHGHLYTPETIYIRPDGSRECIICRRMRDSGKLRKGKGFKLSGHGYFGYPTQKELESKYGVSKSSGQG